MKRIFWIMAFVGVLSFCWQLSIIAKTQQEIMPATQSMDIKDFVHQTFIHGVPYEEANKYGSDDVPTLLEMLEDTSEQAHWSNIVVTLSIIGNETAVDAVLDYINKEEQGELSVSHYTAKTSAVMALGYAVNKNGNKKALNYLKSCLNPSQWEAKKLGWTSPFQASVADRNVQLSTMAVLGLALSGNAEAAEALRSLQEPGAATTEVDKQFQAQVSNVVSDALNTLDMVAKDGLIEYYKKTMQHVSEK